MKDKKSHQVYRWCLQYIAAHRFSNNMKMPSENSVKRLFGFSRETIRTAYDQLEAEGLIERHQGSGTYINKAKAISYDLGLNDTPRKIGLISQGRITSPSDTMIQGIQDVLSEHNINLSVFVTDNQFFNERKLLETISFQGYRGFIIDGVKSSFISPNIDCYQALYHKNFPIIFYNNYYKELAYPKVCVNNHKAAHFLIGELIKAGHRNITGFFVYDNIQSIEKFHGMLDILRRHKITFTDDQVKWLSSDETMSQINGKVIKRFLNAASKSTAIVCCNYSIYTLVMKILSEQNMQVPKDYSVVCFDYTKDDYEKAGVTCTIHRGYDMGVHMARQIIKMIEDHSIDSKKYSYTMSPSLYIGTSVQQLSPSKNHAPIS